MSVARAAMRRAHVIAWDLLYGLSAAAVVAMLLPILYVAAVYNMWRHRGQL